MKFVVLTLGAGKKDEDINRKKQCRQDQYSVAPLSHFRQSLKKFFLFFK